MSAGESFAERYCKVKAFRVPSRPVLSARLFLDFQAIAPIVLDP